MHAMVTRILILKKTLEIVNIIVISNKWYQLEIQYNKALSYTYTLNDTLPLSSI